MLPTLAKEGVIVNQEHWEIDKRTSDLKMSFTWSTTMKDVLGLMNGYEAAKELKEILKKS